MHGSGAELRTFESCYDGIAGTATGAVGTGTAAGWYCTASSELQDLDVGNSGWCAFCDDNLCLDGGYACARETLKLCWRRSVVEELDMLSLSAAVSPELRALMEKARTTAADMRNVNLTAPSKCGADSCTTCSA